MSPIVEGPPREGVFTVAGAASVGQNYTWLTPVDFENFASGNTPMDKSRLDQFQTNIDAGLQAVFAASSTSGYVLPSATAAALGGVRMTGDFGGTGNAPTVPKLAQKADIVTGYDVLYRQVSTGALFSRSTAGTFTAVPVTVTLGDKSVSMRHLNQGARRLLWVPSDVVSETYEWRYGQNFTMSTQSLRVRLAGGAVIPAGESIGAIEFWSGTTGATGIVHLLFGLYDQSFNLIATSADQGATTWAASTAKRVNLTAPTAVQTFDRPVYAALYMEQGTPTMTVYGTQTTASAVVTTPVMGAAGDTLTAGSTALPNPHSTLTSGSATAYARLIRA